MRQLVFVALTVAYARGITQKDHPDAPDVPDLGFMKNIQHVPS